MAGKVSVIIPTHNRAALLGEAVASVRAQTYTDWEIVIVDDGSEPPVDAAALHAELGERIRLVRNQQPMRLAYARDPCWFHARVTVRWRGTQGHSASIGRCKDHHRSAVPSCGLGPLAPGPSFAGRRRTASRGTQQVHRRGHRRRCCVCHGGPAPR